MKMKQLSLIAVAALLMSCGGGSQNQTATETAADSTSTAASNEQPTTEYVLSLDTQTSGAAPLATVRITDNNVTINQKDGKSFDYKVNRAQSGESIYNDFYQWTFAIERLSPDAPDFVTMEICDYMTEIYGEPSQFTHNTCILVTPAYREGEGFNDGEGLSYITNKIELPRQYFDKYPTSEPYPELVFEATKFTHYDDGGAHPLPDVIANAKKISVIDSKLTATDGANSIDLEIMPLSDYERVYSEGYVWGFTTKPAGDTPSLQWEINTGFPDGWSDIPEDERWVNVVISDCGYYSNVKFHSWSNLKRKMSVCYPDDDEYQTTMDEGVYPDVEEDY